MTNGMKGYAQGRESRPLGVDRCVREYDGRDHMGLGPGRERTTAIRRNRGNKVVDSERVTIASQMKKNRVRRSSGQVTLSGSEGNRVNSSLRRVQI